MKPYACMNSIISTGAPEYQILCLYLSVPVFHPFYFSFFFYLSRNLWARNLTLLHKTLQLPPVLRTVQVCDPWKRRKRNWGRNTWSSSDSFLSLQLFKQMLCLSALDRYTNTLVWMCQWYANSYSFKYVLLIVKSWCAPPDTGAGPSVCTIHIHIHSHSMYASSDISFSLSSLSLFFHTCKCTTILKLLHRVMGIWWEQEERLLILFNFPRVHYVGRAQKHVTACLLHLKSAYVVQHAFVCVRICVWVYSFNSVLNGWMYGWLCQTLSVSRAVVVSVCQFVWRR